MLFTTVSKASAHTIPTHEETLSPHLGCPLGYMDIDGVCQDTFSQPALLKCDQNGYMLKQGRCIKYTYEHIIQSCPAGYSIDSTGKCAIQTACEKNYHCVTGTLDETLASCINHFHTEAELDCGETGVFIQGLCYESVMSAPVLTCLEGYEKIGNECVSRLFEAPTLVCETGFTNVANRFCEGKQLDAQLPYCADGSSPQIIDGLAYCTTVTDSNGLKNICNDGWTYVATETTSEGTVTVDKCRKVHEMEPTRICPADGEQLNYDEENKEWRCIYNDYAVAPARCEHPNAVPQYVGSETMCEIDIRRPTTLSCNDFAGYVLDKNQCVWTNTVPPQDDCQNGQYDPVADVCYTHRYVTGDYICPEGCHFERSTGDCVCSTRVQPVVECPLHCYKSNNNCYKNTVIEDVTLCPAGYAYDLSKDLCSKETNIPPVEYCPDGSVPQEGACYVTIQKDLSYMCPDNYALSGDICVRI